MLEPYCLHKVMFVRGPNSSLVRWRIICSPSLRGVLKSSRPRRVECRMCRPTASMPLYCCRIGLLPTEWVRLCNVTAQPYRDYRQRRPEEVHDVQDAKDLEREGNCTVLYSTGLYSFIDLGFQRVFERRWICSAGCLSSLTRSSLAP